MNRLTSFLRDLHGSWYASLVIAAALLMHDPETAVPILSLVIPLGTFALLRMLWVPLITRVSAAMLRNLEAEWAQEDAERARARAALRRSGYHETSAGEYVPAGQQPGRVSSDMNP